MDRSVTVAIARHVAPGMDDAFAALAERMTSAAALFPGHLGAGHIRPAEPDGEHIIVYRFDTPEHLEAWRDSEVRLVLLEELRGIMVGHAREETAVGLESWFSDAASPARAPVLWKQGVAIWLGLFPIAYLFSLTLVPLLGEVPGVMRVAATTVLTVALMTVVVMPVVTRVLGGWLRR